jgi:hypothetical protein
MVPALVAIAPLAKLPHARLEHLIGVKAGILTEESVRQRRDQRFGWVTEDQMAGNKASRSTDLLLAIKCVEQRGADFLGATGRPSAPSRGPAGLPQVCLIHPAECIESSYFRDSRTRGIREQERSCLTGGKRCQLRRAIPRALRGWGRARPIPSPPAGKAVETGGDMGGRGGQVEVAC